MNSHGRYEQQIVWSVVGTDGVITNTPDVIRAALR